MYLFGCNLRDAGLKLASKLQGIEAEVMGINDLIELVRTKKVVSVSRGEEAQAVAILRRQFGISMHEYDQEVGLPQEDMQFEGMIVLTYQGLAKSRQILEGERYLTKEFKPSAIKLLRYRFPASTQDV